MNERGAPSASKRKPAKTKEWPTHQNSKNSKEVRKKGEYERELSGKEDIMAKE